MTVGVGLVVGRRDAHVELLADRDLGAVAAEALAVGGEGVELAGHLVDRSGQVGLVGVLGHEPQGLLLAAAPDHHRDATDRRRLVDGVLDLVAGAVEARALVAEHRQDDLQRLLQLLEPVGEGAELEAERVVLELEPPGADAELGPTVRDDVERGDDLGQQRRVAVRVAGDEGAQAHVRGLPGQGAERRVALEHEGVGVAQHRQLVEVVHQQHRVEARPVGRRRLGRHLVEQPGRADAGIGEVGDLVAEPGHGCLLVRTSSQESAATSGQILGKQRPCPSRARPWMSPVA